MHYAEYYEVRSHGGQIRFQSVSKIEAEFFARGLIRRGEARPEIWSMPRA